MSSATVSRPVRAGASKLSRELHAPGQRAAAGPLEAFRSARRAFLRGEQIDMGSLAAEFGVDRATIFRWLGNRDQLLEEVIWSFAEPAWQRALAASTGSGPGRVRDVLAHWIGAITAPEADYFHAWLRREPARALRLLTTREGLHQQRSVDLVEHLLLDELARSPFPLPLPVHDLAYVITRIGESFVYSDLITGDTPDASKAAAAVGALLGAPTH